MARPRKPAKAKEPQSSLEKALAFVKVAQIDKGRDLALKSHCRLANSYAVAFDGVLAVGHPIEEELNVCPHTFRLMDALKRCKTALSITQLEGDKLVIKSGGFRAVIPCLNPAAIPYAVPDANVGAIDDTIKEGFTLLNPIVSGTGATTVEASLLLQNNSMVATDRYVMLEFWHGINLPDGLAIPKVAVAAVAKISTPLVGIGVSARTVTFHYEGGAWLRTQLYGEKWPDISRVINQGDPHVANTLPPALFDAVEAVASFSPDGAIHTFDGVISSHNMEGAGATYEIKGITPGLCFGAKHLLVAKNGTKTIDLVGSNGVSFFYGERIRGALTQRRG
jgi:hypothetical protein